MGEFTIDYDKTYVIYGAGGNASHVIRLLRNMKYKIEAVLDVRAKDIRVLDDIPVYTLSDFAKLDLNKDKCVILVTIKNVFEHVNIVRSLIDYGYENIIYKPYAILQGEHDMDWDSIDYAYEMIVEKKQLSEENQICIAKSNNEHLVVYKDELCIEKTKEVTCWIPVELLCNYDREDAFRLIPMGAFYPILNMYHYLLNNLTVYDWDTICDDFLLYSADWIKRNGKQFTDSLKKNMIRSRIEVFGEMQKKSDIDKQFFVRNMVSVERKSGLCFHLLSSGRNRIAFLIAKGYRYIPTKMSLEDYSSWIDNRRFDEFKNFLQEKRISKLFTTVPHPMLSTYPTKTVDYVHLFCLPVIKEIYRFLHKCSIVNENSYGIIDNERYMELMRNTTIGVAMIDDGCFARLMRMYGFSSRRLFINLEQNEISGQIDRLLQMPPETENQVCLSIKELVNESDILVLDSRVSDKSYGIFGGKKIFWLQWGTDELEQNIEKRYCHKKEIFSSIWMDKKVFGWMLE